MVWDIADDLLVLFCPQGTHSILPYASRRTSPSLPLPHIFRSPRQTSCLFPYTFFSYGSLAVFFWHALWPLRRKGNEPSHVLQGGKQLKPFSKSRLETRESQLQCIASGTSNLSGSREHALGMFIVIPHRLSHPRHQILPDCGLWGLSSVAGGWGRRRRGWRKMHRLHNTGPVLQLLLSKESATCHTLLPEDLSFLSLSNTPTHTHKLLAPGTLPKVFL